MSGYQTISAVHKFRLKNQIVTQRKDPQSRNIAQWQSNKMRQIIIDRWQEIWVAVKARNKTPKNSTKSLKEIALTSNINLIF